MSAAAITAPPTISPVNAVAALDDLLELLQVPPHPDRRHCRLGGATRVAVGVVEARLAGETPALAPADVQGRGVSGGEDPDREPWSPKDPEAFFALKGFGERPDRLARVDLRVGERWGACG